MEIKIWIYRLLVDLMRASISYNFHLVDNFNVYNGYIYLSDFLLDFVKFESFIEKDQVKSFKH